jgi:peptidoglycan/xylan/chitin deacetylase (PgdA/CDA1 family)
VKTLVAKFLDDQSQELPAITIMFDDGLSSVYQEALPLLEKFDYPANVATVGSMIGKPGYMNAEEFKDLLSKGWALSDHTYSHINCKHSQDDQIRNEVLSNREAIFEAFNYKLRDFVFPKSKVSESAKNLVLSLYDFAFTGTTKITSETSPFQHRLLKRTEITTYERVLYRLRGIDFHEKLRQYLVNLSLEKRPEWLILFTHKVVEKPGFFDTRKSDFSQILGAIHSTGIPVKSTHHVLRSEK